MLYIKISAVLEAIAPSGRCFNDN